MGTAKRVAVAVATLFLLGGVCWSSPPSEPKSGTPKPPPPLVGDAKLTDADRLSQLRRSLAELHEQLEQVLTELDSPTSELRLAEAGVSELDTLSATGPAELERLRKAGRTAAAEELDKQLASLPERRRRASERLAVALEARQTLLQKLESLRRQREQLQGELDTLLGVTEAERLARLDAAIEQTEAQLAARRAVLTEGLKTVAEVEAEIQQATTARDAAAKELTVAREAGQFEKIPAAEKTLAERDDALRKSQDRLTELRRRREAARLVVARLDRDRLRNRELLRRLQESIASAVPTEAVATKAAATKTGPVARPEPPAPVAKTDTGSAGTPTSGSSPMVALPGGVTVSLPGVPDAAAPKEPTAAEGMPDPNSARGQEIQAAREELARLGERVVEIEQQLAELEKAAEEVVVRLTEERKLADTARRQEALADADQREAWQDLQSAFGLAERLSTVPEQIKKSAAANTRLREARAAVAAADQRVAKLVEELSKLQSRKLTALRELDKRRDAAMKVQARLSELEHPSLLRRLRDWVLERGLRVVGLLMLIVALYVLVRRFSRALAAQVSRADSRGNSAERENRVATLISVIDNLSTVLLFVGVVVLLLNETEFGFAPVFGGAAIVGAAIAFGSQNLIRDYFTGFVILMENQFAVGDVIRIGSVAGLVEAVTLRVTILRDIDGTVHIIPNGQIQQVSNLTYEWSRALLDIRVSYRTDLSQAMQLLTEIGRELRREPGFDYLILDDPEMLGVEELSDSSVVIRFFIKTRPCQQWTVKREMLKRIKRRFQDGGIEIPFPQQTVHIDTVVGRRDELITSMVDGARNRAEPTSTVSKS